MFASCCYFTDSAAAGFTRQSPHSFWLRGLRTVVPNAGAADIIAAVQDGARLPLPKDTPTEFAALIGDCWHPDPSKRPTMTVVRDRLLALLPPMMLRAPSLVSSLQPASAFSMSQM